MPPRPDPRLPPDPPSLAPDRTLWWGLAGGIALIALLALAVHRFVPQAPSGSGGGKANLNRNAPLMTRPQLLENQQAMPELLDFDAQNPPPNPPAGGGALGTPGPPSSLGTGTLGQ
jgi:hypothetical protein